MVKITYERLKNNGIKAFCNRKSIFDLCPLCFERDGNSYVLIRSVGIWYCYKILGDDFIRFIFNGGVVINLDRGYFHPFKEFRKVYLGNLVPSFEFNNEEILISLGMNRILRYNVEVRAKYLAAAQWDYCHA